MAAGLEDATVLLIVARNNTTETVEKVEANVTAVRGGARPTLEHEAAAEEAEES